MVNVCQDIVRSRLDNRCEVYYSNCKSYLTKVNAVHNSAYRIHSPHTLCGKLIYCLQTTFFNFYPFYLIIYHDILLHPYHRLNNLILSRDFNKFHQDRSKLILKIQILEQRVE